MGGRALVGWGVRTMSSGGRRYNPLSYHNGTVGPHDKFADRYGLARAARWPRHTGSSGTMLTAAGHFNISCPRSSQALHRSETGFPIALPDGGAAPGVGGRDAVLLLQLLLGPLARPARQVLETSHRSSSLLVRAGCG